MNQEIKVKWLEALRSGKYQQGSMQLKDPFNNTYCCLGVLCDITGCKWNASYATYKQNSSNITVPMSLREELGLIGPDCRILMEMNDRGTSFNEIADYIEKNL